MEDLAGSWSGETQTLNLDCSLSSRRTSRVSLETRDWIFPTGCEPTWPVDFRAARTSDIKRISVFN